MVIKQILRCDGKFDSAHQLDSHKGKCRNLHGHTWLVQVEIEVIKNDDAYGDIIVDFGDIKNLINNLDHKNLNEKLSCLNPTAEFLSAYFATEIFKLTPKKKGIDKISVTVSEGGSSTITTELSSDCIAYLNYIDEHTEGEQEDFDITGDAVTGC